METKKSKIKERKVAFYKEDGVDELGMPKKVPDKDQYGNITFSLTMENGDNGLLKAQKDFERFNEGQEIEYTIEEKESQQGKKYNVIRLPKQDRGSYSGGGGSRYQPKKKVAYKADMVSFGFSYAKDIFVAGKMPVVDDKEVTLGDLGKMLTKTMWKTLDELEGLE